MHARKDEHTHVGEGLGAYIDTFTDNGKIRSGFVGFKGWSKKGNIC